MRRRTHQLLIITLLLAGTAAGCTRKFYRKRTDDDVVGLLTEKNQNPNWLVESWYIYPDQRARFSDNSNPDRPPKPPDDLASYILSPDSQPRHHTKLMESSIYLKYLETWDLENRAKLTQRPTVARAQAIDYADISEETASTFESVLKSNCKTYMINLEQSAELALFNSREYQDRREDLYAAALPLTVERFSFVSQFFATQLAVREATGSQTPEGKGNRWRLDTANGFTKLFPSGATLLLQLANKLVIEMGSGGRVTTGASNLTLELAQPLLKGGGYAVTMEPLTQAERDLLYAVRSWARFRKIYYTYLAGGLDNLFNSPYSYAGLSLRGIGPTLSAGGQGYYPTLLLSFLEKNEVDNIAGLERYWKVYQAFEEGGDVSRLQVDQVEQNLLNGRSRLLQRRLEVQNGIDNFKLQLGLPTPLPLELDDSPMQPLARHMARFNIVRDEFDAIRKAASDVPDNVRRPMLLLGGGLLSLMPIDLPIRPRLAKFFTDSPAVRGTVFQKNIMRRWQRWEKLDDDAMRIEQTKLGDEQRDILGRKARLEVENKRLPKVDEDRLNYLRSEMNIGRFEASLRRYERKPWLKEPPARMAREQDSVFRDAINSFNLTIGEAREERLGGIRLAWPQLPGVVVESIDLLKSDLDQSQTVAAQVALNSRLELMNARSQLVDAWRQIAVRANALMGILTVGYQYEGLSAPGDYSPFAVGGSASRHKLQIAGELPLVRRVERNEYRTSLIAFQRQRRILMATEDFILNDVRTDLRQLRVLAENYKIQQRAVEVAYAQVENSLDVLQAPPDPRTLAGGQTAGNAAALTQQLLNAQNSLLQAQNNLYTVWVNYLIARMTFYRDLEMLPLDPRGVWLDEYSPDVNAGNEAEGPARESLERIPWPVPAAGLGPAAPRRLNELPLPEPIGTGPRWEKAKQ